MRKLIQANLLPIILVILAVFLVAWFSFTGFHQGEIAASDTSTPREFLWEVFTRPFAWTLH